MELGVEHADLAHASSALCQYAFLTLCHIDRGITILILLLFEFAWILVAFVI
jgi:hypothetical protein